MIEMHKDWLTYKLDVAGTYLWSHLNVLIRKEAEDWGLVHKEYSKKESQNSSS